MKGLVILPYDVDRTYNDQVPECIRFTSAPVIMVQDFLYQRRRTRRTTARCLPYNIKGTMFQFRYFGGARGHWS